MGRVDINGTGYVSLPALLEQSGGAYNVLPSRIRIDFEGTTAWLTVDDVRVHALSIFSLRHPIRSIEEDVLIAADDVPPFFLKSFRARVSVAEEQVPEVPTAETSEEDDGVAKQNGSLPESVPGAAKPMIARDVQVIVIDPGHGGYDTGLEGVAGTLEKDLTLDISRRVAEGLKASLSQTIVVTRSGDIGLTAEQRARIAENSGGDLFLSVHASGSLSPSASGYSVYYQPRPRRGGLVQGGGNLRSRLGNAGRDVSRPSRTLALAISEKISEAVVAPDRGVHGAPMRPLTSLRIPGVLVEVGCLTTPSDESLLATEEHRERIAYGIVQGILSYLGTPVAAAVGARGDSKQEAGV